MRASLLCGAWIVLTACQPTPPNPVKVMAIVPSTAGAYEPRQVELTTITGSVAALKGTVVSLVGGAGIELDPNDPLLAGVTTDEQYAEVITKNHGADVRANYIDKGGVLWPADYQSWAMTTTFYNFEQTFKYYQFIYSGKSSDELLGVSVDYWVSYRVIGAAVGDIHDDAFFFPPTRSFLLVPFEKLQTVPFELNIGVIGHEYGHLVFNTRVFSGSRNPPALTTGGFTREAFNLLKSLDEGLADFHGYGVTCFAPGPGCRPSFLAASIPDKEALAARDLSDDKHCLTTELRTALEGLEGNAFLRGGYQYGIGTLVSTALYQAGNKTGKLDVLQKALIDAYASTPEQPAEGLREVIKASLLTGGAGFSPELMTDTIAAHITDLELRKTVCDQLIDRLQLQCPGDTCEAPVLGVAAMNVPNGLPHCPTTSSRGKTVCKALGKRQ